MKLHDKDFDDLEIEDLETVKKRVAKKKHRNRRRGESEGLNIPPVVIPVIVALILIIILFSLSIGNHSFPGLNNIEVNADISEAFGGLQGNEAGIILNDACITETKAINENGKIYLPYEFIKSELNDWFYHDENEGLILYTTPEGTDRIEEGSDAKEIGGVFCLSSSLVRKYTNMDYTEYLDKGVPYIVIRNSWGKYSSASVVRKTGLFVSADKKSDVTAILNESDPVRILESGNEWTKVENSEGLTGFVKNKDLGDYKDAEDIAPSNVAEMVFPSTAFNEKVILGWHQLMNQDANNLVGDILAKDTAINVLSPTWYSLTDTDGGLKDNSSTFYVESSHNAGKQVWAVIDNFNTEGFSPAADTYEVLSYTSKRQRVTEALVSSVKNCGADGINVDFEELSGETGEHFAQFVKELSVASHDAGLIFSVDNYVPENYSQHYHREVQGKVCDFVIIMGYDEHNASSTEAGPVASLGFVENGIDKTLMDVDASKVINGLPFYTRIWETDNGTVKSTQAMSMTESAAILESHGVTPAWDDGAGCNYGEFEMRGSLWKLWLEDEQSLAAKLSIMNSKSLAGAAFWKLGLEDSSVWDDISAYANGN